MQQFCNLLKCIFTLLLFFEELFVVIGVTTFPAEHKVRVDVQWPAVSSSKKIEDEEYDDLLLMTAADKSQYRCTIPSLYGNSMKHADENYRGPNPLQLLRPIFSKLLCYFRLDTYWSYELCHGYYFRQFHEETTARGRVLQEFFLGQYEPSKGGGLDYSTGTENDSLLDLAKTLPKVRVEDAELPYLMINMSEGTFCGLRGKPRSTRVLYVCHPRGNNGIYSFRETSTCEYEVIVLTTVLCKHPAFKIDYFTDSVVNCYPLPGSPPKPKAFQEESAYAKSTLVEEPEKPKDAEPDKLKEQKPKEAETKPKDTEHAKDTERAKPKKKQQVTKAKITTSKQPDAVPHDPKLMDDVLSGDYCLQGGSGWWRYEFCYGKKVQQYHENTDGSRTYILLGIWDVNKHLEWLEKHPSKKIKSGKIPNQISHFYSGGDFCDEEKKPRQLEVKLKCKDVFGHPDSVTLYFSEPNTCEYELIAESAIFCSVIMVADENGLTANIK